MVALILEEDQHSRSVLTAMLTGKQGLGYSSALAATGFVEIEYLIKQNLSQIGLILSSNAAMDGQDFPLIRLVLREPQLHLVPFIMMINGGQVNPLSRVGDRLSRVDSSIRKPFGFDQLKQSLYEAHRRRQILRSSLLVLGHSVAFQFAEAFYACRNLVHWQEVVPVTSTAALDEKINELGFRVGGILLDPLHCDEAAIARIVKFKKTHQGSTAQVAVLSRNPAEISGIRLSSDIYFDPPHASEPVEWEEIILRLSRRAILNWEAREIVSQGRQALSAGNVKLASKLAKNAISLDSGRWEFNELAGSVARRMEKKYEAITYFMMAQRTNPCSPFTYLNLIKLLEGEALGQILDAAQSYCPKHPQIMSQIAELRGGTGAHA